MADQARQSPTSELFVRLETEHRLKCAACGKEAAYAIVEIADWRDRTAMEWLRENTPKIPCQACGSGLAIGTPILVIRPGDPIRLIAGFPWDSDPADDMAELRRLMAVPGVPSIKPLPIAMADLGALADRYTGSALALLPADGWSDRETQWLEAIRPHLTVPALRTELVRFLSAGDDEADDIARASDGLLDAAWVPVVDELIEQTRDLQPDPDAAEVIRRRGFALTRLRGGDIGVGSGGLPPPITRMLAEATDADPQARADRVQVLRDLIDGLRDAPDHRTLLAGALITFVATASSPPWRTPDSLRLAIDAGPQAIALAEEMFGVEHPSTLTVKQDLAAAILDRQDGSPAESEQRAMRLFRDVATTAVRTENRLLADVVQNWATALAHHTLDGRTDNQVLAVSLFLDALHLHKVLRPHDRRAALIVRLNLAATLRESRVGNVLRSTIDAIEIYRDILRKPAQAQLLNDAQLAQAEANLVTALFQLWRMNPELVSPDEIVAAVKDAAGHNEALANGDPVRIRALSNLGAVLGELYQDTFAADEPRLDLLTEAQRLSALAYADAVEHLAERHDELIRVGVNYVATLARPRPDSDRDPSGPELILLELLELAAGAGLAAHRYTIARNLGQHYAARSEWSDATRYFGIALDNVQQLFLDAKAPSSRLAELGMAADLAGWLTVIHLLTRNTSGAIEALERSRARLLRRDVVGVSAPRDARPTIYVGVGVLGSWAILRRTGGRSPLAMRTGLRAAELRPFVAAVRRAIKIDELMAPLDDLVDVLQGPILQPVLMMLQEEGLDDVDVVPTGLLAGLPLHALTADPATGRRWLDHATVRYIPSRAVADRWTDEAYPRSANSVLAFAIKEGNLECASWEPLLIPEFLGAHVERPPDADQTRWLVEGLRSASHAHIACHAEWVPDDPLRSSINLDPPHEARLGDLLDLDCRQLDLAVLSCCSSGVSVEALSDELLGFGSAMLLAGARSAIVSSWNIDDLAASLVVAAFYRELRQGEEPGGALRKAQLWVSDLTIAQLRRLWDDARFARPDALLPDGLAGQAAMTLVGAPPAEHRPFRHPAYFASLCYHGPMWRRRADESA